MIKKVVVSILLTGFITGVFAQTVSPFQNNDRVVFLGNSITQDGHYYSYIWLYYMTRFPDRRIDIFNAGVSGDVSKQMYDRIEEDVFAKKPTVVAVSFGFNDTGWDGFSGPASDSLIDSRVQKSYADYLLMEKKFNQHPEVRKVIIGEPPYDGNAKIKLGVLSGKNQSIIQVTELAKASAQKNKYDFVDFNQPMLDITRREQEKDSTFTLSMGDRVHPGPMGHFIMAYFFLKSQGLHNNDIASVAIDASGKQQPKAANCTVTGLAATPTFIRYNYLANALPYPVDTVKYGFGKPRTPNDALKLIPFTDEFNREMVQVANLKPGKYTLEIDGREIGRYTHQDFEKGINLATLTNTPQYQQALGIMLLNNERWDIERKLRLYYSLNFTLLRQKGLMFADNDAAQQEVTNLLKTNPITFVAVDNYSQAKYPIVRQGWEKQMKAIVDEIYELNKPVMRHVSITAVN